MRLYPPAWLIGRRALVDYPLGGYVVPAQSIIIMSPYVLQRDARYYADPERFDPDRWTPAFRAGLPKFAYFPFGGGPRQCIGESFAWMELVWSSPCIARNGSCASCPAIRSRRSRSSRSAPSTECE
jgi:cytochrome P450